MYNSHIGWWSNLLDDLFKDWPDPRTVDGLLVLDGLFCCNVTLNHSGASEWTLVYMSTVHCEVYNGTVEH